VLNTAVRSFLLLFLLTGLGVSNLNAQRQKVINLQKYDMEPYHFGFILAANQMLFTVKPIDGHQFIVYGSDMGPDFASDSLSLYEVTSTPTPGFTIGIVGNLRLGSNADLRFIPSLSFGERYLDYSIMRYRNGTPELIDIRKSVASTYVEFPLLVKYRSKRLNNFAAYLLGGAKYSIDLASNKRNDRENNNIAIKLNNHDLALEVGTGVDFYTNYFKFGVELKMGYGLTNILVDDGSIYSASIERLNSKIFQLSFTFE
jgi:hypothetical protein